MRVFAVFLVVFVMLSLAGCADTFSTLSAVEQVSQYYSSMDSGGGKVTVLAVEPIGKGMLVLAKKVDDANYIRLFKITGDGVAGTAAGLAAGDARFSVNQVADGGQTILFGHFGRENKESSDGTGRPFEKAVMMLRNWKTVEQELAEGHGYILVIKNSKGVSKLDLVGPDGHLGADEARGGRIYQATFKPVKQPPERES